MKVVAFNGSPRKDGNTAVMLGAVLRELEILGFETELVQLKGPLSGCIACGKCFEKANGRCAIDKDMINECIEKMVAADGIIIGSPTRIFIASRSIYPLGRTSTQKARLSTGIFLRIPLKYR